MAREVASMPTALWREPGFAALSWRAQRLYFLLSTQPNLSQAGHLPLAPRRWAGMSSDGQAEQVLEDLRELEEARWAWIDWDLEDVVVRRHTPPRGHKQLQGALQATFDISSPALRQMAVDGLLVDQGVAPRGNTAFARTRLEVHTRDNFTCRSCDWRPAVPDGYDGRYALGLVFLDREARQYRVRLLELDHVYPEFLGGKFELSNLQTLCNSCNASKGARV